MITGCSWLAVFTMRSVAERGIAVISCLSVRLSVTLVDCDHTRWNSSKIISRMISFGFAGDVVSNASAFVENASFLFRSLYLPHEVPHWLYISKFTRLRTVFRRQHGSCPYRWLVGALIRRCGMMNSVPPRAWILHYVKQSLHRQLSSFQCALRPWS